MSRYAWIIDRDYIADEIDTDRMGKDCVAVEVAGPSDASPAQVELARKRGWPFKMYDDDGILYYSGRCWSAEGWGDETLFGPLDDYGMPNAGAVTIKYRNPETGKWETF